MPTVKPFTIECCQCGRETVCFTCHECRKPVCGDCDTLNYDGLVICKQHERDRWRDQFNSNKGGDTDGAR